MTFLPDQQAECLRWMPLTREAAGRWPALRGGGNPGRRYALPRAGAVEGLVITRAGTYELKPKKNNEMDIVFHEA